MCKANLITGLVIVAFGLIFLPKANAAPTRVSEWIGDTTPVLPPTHVEYLGFIHEVGEGESFRSICKKYRVRLDHVLVLNRLKRDEALRPGYLLKIPAESQENSDR